MYGSGRLAQMYMCICMYVSNVCVYFLRICIMQLYGYYMGVYASSILCMDEKVIGIIVHADVHVCSVWASLKIFM